MRHVLPTFGESHHFNGQSHRFGGDSTRVDGHFVWLFFLLRFIGEVNGATTRHQRAQ